MLDTAHPVKAPLELHSICAYPSQRLKVRVGDVQGFIRQASRDIVIQCEDAGQLIAKLEAYTPPPSIIKLALEGKLLHNLRG